MGNHPYYPVFCGCLPMLSQSAALPHRYFRRIRSMAGGSVSPPVASGWQMRITIVISIFLALLALLGPSLSAGCPRHAVSVLPTPVFNTPDLVGIFGGRDGMTLRLDPCGQLRELEFIALPGSVFRIESAIAGKHSLIYRVTTDEYPYPTDKGYFI